MTPEVWIAAIGGVFAILFGVQKIIRQEIVTVTKPIEVRVDGLEKTTDRHELDLRDLRKVDA